MNKLDNFRFGSTHRRSMRNVFITAAAVFIIAVGLLAVIGVFGSRSSNIRIVIGQQNNGVSIEGAGLNLLEIPTSNRIVNGDFETSVRAESFTVDGADNSYLYFGTESGIDYSGIVTGDRVDVLSMDSNGVMGLRYTGIVRGISYARLGMNNLIEDSDGAWYGDPIADTASSDGVIDAITVSGKLIADLTGEYSLPLGTDDSSRFVDICSSGDVVYALSDSGSIYMSGDGRSFNILADLNLEEDEGLYIACCDSSLVILTSDGDLWNLSNGRKTLLDSGYDSSRSCLISNGEAVILCSGNRVYYSNNGFYFSLVQNSSRMSATSRYVSAAISEDTVYLLNNLGQLIVIGSDMSFEVRNIFDISPVNIVCSSEGDLIAASSDGHAYLVNEDGSYTNLTAGSVVVDSVFQGNNEKILLSSGNSLFAEKVLTGLQMMDSIPSETVLSGDICMVSSMYSSAIESWDSYGEDTRLSIVTSDNDKSLCLSGTGIGVHAVSQRLSGNISDNFSENNFYRMEFNLKGTAEGSIKAWIEGGNILEGFETSVTEKAETVSFVFAVTESDLDEDAGIRFNIAFEGSGEIYIDDIYLGEDRYSGEDIPAEYRESVVSSKPAAIRLPYLNFGCSGYSQNHFYGMSFDSLEQSMRLVRDSYSCPWFVVGSDIKQGDVNAFLSYMCGTVSSEYGKLRTDNGTALPWNRQFDRIYIEITDDIGAYCSDVQRGAYVSYVIGLFRQSDNYVDIRDKVIFLDGMMYDGGTVLSSADYHTMGLHIDFDDENQGIGNYLDSVYGAYSDFNYDVPRVPSHVSGGGEFISSLSFDNDVSMNTARLCGIYLNEYTDYIRLVLFDVPVSDRMVDTESDAVFADQSVKTLLGTISELSFVRNTEGMFYEVADPLDSSSANTAESFSGSCIVKYLADREARYLIVANTSDSQQQFITDGVDLISSDAVIRRYAAGGELLFDRNVNHTDLRYTLQPGEVIIFIIDNE